MARLTLPLTVGSGDARFDARTDGHGLGRGRGGTKVSQVTFLASFPPIQSAIKVTGGGDGMRIQLDVPESEMGNAIELLAWRQRVLKVTVELENGEYAEKSTKIHI